MIWRLGGRGIQLGCAKIEAKNGQPQSQNLSQTQLTPKPKPKPKTTNSWPPYATDFGLVSMCKSGTFFSACKPKLVSHRACRKNVLDLHVEKTSWICTWEKSLDFQIAPHKEASLLLATICMLCCCRCRYSSIGLARFLGSLSP